MEAQLPEWLWSVAGDDRDDLAPASDLSAALAAPPSWRERLGTRWLRRTLQPIRIYRAFIHGAEAEADGLHARAAFYFETACDELERVSDRLRVRKHFGAADEPDVAAIAARNLLRIHVRFFLGYAAREQPRPGDRALTHVTWAERVLPLAVMPHEDTLRWQLWLRRQTIAAFAGAARHDEALSLFETTLVQSSPDDFKDSYIEAFRAHALAGLGDAETDEQKRAHGKSIDASLKRLRGFFTILADRPLALECLADLLRRRVALFVDESTSTRLELLQRAVDADPFNHDLHALDTQSRIALADAQHHVQQLEVQAAVEGKQFDEKGMVLRNEIMSAFQAARRYLQSDDSRTVQQAAMRMWSAERWSALELPQDEGWRTRATTLTKAIAAALCREELASDAFASTLAEEMAGAKELAELDAPAIAARLIALEGLASPAIAPITPVAPVVPGSDSDSNAAADLGCRSRGYRTGRGLVLQRSRHGGAPVLRDRGHPHRRGRGGDQL